MATSLASAEEQVLHLSRLVLQRRNGFCPEPFKRFARLVFDGVVQIGLFLGREADVLGIDSTGRETDINLLFFGMAHDNARQEGAQDAKSFGISFAEWATDCILKEFGSGELGHPKEAKLSLKIFQSVT